MYSEKTSFTSGHPDMVLLRANSGWLIERAAARACRAALASAAVTIATD